MTTYQMAFSSSFKPENSNQDTLATKLIYVDAKDLVDAVEKARSHAVGLAPLYVASYALDDSVVFGHARYVFWDEATQSGFLIEHSGDYEYLLIEERSGVNVARIPLATYGNCRHMAQARLSAHLAWKQEQYSDFKCSVEVMLDECQTLQNLTSQILCFPKGARVSDAKEYFSQIMC